MNRILNILRPQTNINSCIRIIHNKVKKVPEAGKQCLWRKVHYPEKYTVKPLDTTNLAGRDPKTGRVAHIGIGGGIKHKYHWVDFKRVGPYDDSPPQEERVVEILKDGHRSGNIALVAVNDKLKYIIATENMKPGDILKTSCFIPRIPVRGKEGDAYPIGALPIGTIVNCIEKFPNKGAFYAKAAGTYATIVQRKDDRVIIQLPSKHQVALDQRCMGVIGRISNIDHNKMHIGSGPNLRYLGYRPRSGLWHRKDGHAGRKIRPLPPVLFVEKKEKPCEVLILSPDKC